MANETITSGAGLRKARVYALSTAGLPDGDQSGADGYNGENVTGVKAVTLNVPENQRIQHVGDDQTFAQDFLPPTELPSGNFTTAKTNQTLDALLQDTLVQTIGEWELDALSTNKAGQEIDVCFMYWRQALVTDPSDSDFGSRRWQTFIIPKERITPQGNSPDQGSDDVNNYSMTPTGSLITPWGVSFTEDDNGFTRAVRLRATSDYPIMMERYTGNATLATFNTEFSPVSVAKTKAWNADTGAALTVNAIGANSFTVSSAPGNGAAVVALYETADSIS